MDGICYWLGMQWTVLPYVIKLLETPVSEKMLKEMTLLLVSALFLFFILS